MRQQDAQRFLELVLRNPVNGLLLERLPALELPDCFLVGGCLFQTVWNCLSGKAPDDDILDYDVFYHDADASSWQAEDAAIHRARAAFQDLGVAVQLRNQARVHLWYEERFGQACPPLRSTADAIDHFLSASCSFGVRQHAGVTDIYAPYGFEDLFSMTLKPNLRRDQPDAYTRKARRWKQAWPALDVVEWPVLPAAGVHG